MQATLVKADFEVKELPYTIELLEPAISAQTLHYHHGRHYRTYIENLNKLVAGTPFAEMSLEEVVRTSDGAIFNNAAQAWNHEFYFEQFSPTPQNKPSGKLLQLINSSYASLDNLKEQIEKSATALFGSGWVWLVQSQKGNISIINSPNAHNPLSQYLKPLLTIDVWEHAYYLDHQNNRLKAVNALWNILDWSIIEKRV